MAFDFKKEYKEYYLPPVTPSIVDVPPMNYVAVRGKGDPNDEDSEYMASIELLYGLAFTLKMSRWVTGGLRVTSILSFLPSRASGGRGRARWITAARRTSISSR